jgi:preprotein translocase subunit SecF
MNLMRYKWVYFLISAIFLVPGIISLIFFGIRPSIDFTGGTLLEYKISPKENLKPDSKSIKEALEKTNVEVSSLQVSGENIYLIRTKPIDKDKNEAIKKDLSEKFGSLEEIRFETVGPILGQELIRKTIFAVILAASFILLYVAWVFKDKRFGLCAILAMFHDSIILLGAVSLLGHFLKVEADTLFVTAVLTTLSFSVHDTVIVYDRIRESQRRFPKANFTDLVNKAVTETLSRSLNNSLTIIFMLFSLYLLGGTTIKWFVFILLIGTISGTYSSTFTAAPLLVIWEEFKNRKK